MKNLTIILLLLVLLLSACSSGLGSKDTPNLDGTAWTMTEINGRFALGSTTVWISFDGDEVGGSGGCNSYGGDVTKNNRGKMEFGMINMTLMYCMEDGVSDQESKYMMALNEVRTYHMSGGLLVMSNAEGDVILKFTPMAITIED